MYDHKSELFDPVIYLYCVRHFFMCLGHARYYSCNLSIVKEAEDTHEITIHYPFFLWVFLVWNAS